MGNFPFRKFIIIQLYPFPQLGSGALMGPFPLEIAGLLLLLTNSFVRDLEPNRAIGHIRLVLSVFYHKQ